MNMDGKKETDSTENNMAPDGWHGRWGMVSFDVIELCGGNWLTELSDAGSSNTAARTDNNPRNKTSRDVGSMNTRSCVCNRNGATGVVCCIERGVRKIHEFSGRSGTDDEFCSGVVVVDDTANGIGLASAMCVAYVVHALQGVSLTDALDLVRVSLPRARPPRSLVGLLKDWHARRWPATKLINSSQIDTTESESTRQGAVDAQSASTTAKEQPQARIRVVPAVETLQPQLSSLCASASSSLESREDSEVAHVVASSSADRAMHDELFSLRTEFDAQRESLLAQLQELETAFSSAESMIRAKYAGSHGINDAEMSKVGVVSEEQDQASPTDESTVRQRRVFCCRQCRSELFADEDILAHEPAGGQTAFSWRKRDHTRTEDGDVQCTSLFIGELEWLSDATNANNIFAGNSGKLFCKNNRCSARIGSFTWSGNQCSCGHWNTPALQVLYSRVDEKFV